MKWCCQACRPVVTDQFSQSKEKLVQLQEPNLCFATSRISEFAAFFVDFEAKWKLFLLSTVCWPKETTRGRHFGKFLSFNALNDDFCLLLPVEEALKKTPHWSRWMFVALCRWLTVFSQETSGDFNFQMCVARWSGGGENVNNRMLLCILERNSLDDTPSVCL